MRTIGLEDRLGCPHRPAPTSSVLFFLFFNIYLFIYFYFWLHRVLVEARRTFAAARGLSCPEACEILAPRPGIKPTSSALEGGFLTTGPPGKFPMSSVLFPDLRPGLRVWRGLLTTQEPHRATSGHPADPLPCCATSHQLLALSGPYSLTLPTSEPLVVLAVWT